jgi:polysaccharide export outer membrane protein
MHAFTHRIHSSTRRACASAFFALGALALVATSGTAAGAPQQARPAQPALATAPAQDYLLGPGDTIKITVFQNPDLSLETRVSENGTITYPLIGAVQVGGLSTSAAEKRIARMLKDGGFLIDPQVTVLIDQIRGNEVAAIGQFNKPGRYPLETTQTRLSDLIAQAGGIAPTGSDTVIFTGKRDGKPVWQQIDIGNMFVNNQMENDFLLQAGDVLFVDRYPLFYIYGEVQRPGSYRVERNLTLVQALASGGGLTPRGTQKGVRIRRKDATGKVVELKPELDEPVKAEDVIFVRESIF